MPASFFCAYILASMSLTLYIGMTGDLDKRAAEHKKKLHQGFLATYNCNRLVWFERYVYAGSAIAREKQLKGWTSAKKITLVTKTNPTWIDLSENWYTPEQLAGSKD